MECRNQRWKKKNLLWYIRVHGSWNAV